jgi:2-polyprenyl-3-methyl-5-hydroxy-6-metoxy-1,4-benzoquinol methylase
VSGSDYYDREADVYDASRGGSQRAEAAADSVAGLVPAGRLLDVAGGTGIVSEALAARGFDVLVADLSPGMLRLAAARVLRRAGTWSPRSTRGRPTATRVPSPTTPSGGLA